jgi:sugar lactone lactonase YvrE
MTLATELVEGLYFGEGPRWHDGRLWFSDFYDQAVKSLGVDGDVRIEFQLTEQPSGLGWLPDGRLQVVAMESLSVLRQNGEQLEPVADLSAYSKHLCNDMVVDGNGRAWVGNFGFDLDAVMAEGGADAVLANPVTTNLVRVDLDGTVSVAASEMRFPNGSVVTPDGKTLIVAETLGLCLTAFDIAEDGSLSNRREWAPVGLRAPDGICLDADGNIWIANALAPECVLIAPGGEVLAQVETSQNCYACMLGGEDGRSLYIMTAQTSDKTEASAARNGKVEMARVVTPGAGCP